MEHPQALNQPGSYIIPQGADSAVQAMTEVALGLSMAFFAILILALMSMSVDAPDQTTVTEQNASIDKSSIEGDKSMPSSLPSADDAIELVSSAPADKPSSSANDSGNNSEQTSANKLFVFYSNGQLFDASLKPISRSTIGLSKQVTLVLSPELSLSDAIQIKQSFTNDEVVLTQMTEKWQSAFANSTNGDEHGR